MKYAIILVKKEYEELGDFVFRPIVREYEKIGAGNLLGDNGAILLGKINDDGLFIEYFTNEEVPTDSYIEINDEDLEFFLDGLTDDKKDKISEVVYKFILGNEKDDRTIEDLKRDFAIDAHDRGVELEAYENGLSLINPFDLKNPNLYKDFVNKLNICNKAKLQHIKRK